MFKRIMGTSFSSYRVIPVGSLGSTTITVVPPYAAGGRPCSKPLSGNFKISCTDPLGNVFKTRPQAFNRDVRDIQADFEEDISFLRGRVTIHQHNNGRLEDHFKFNYKENNINFYLIFDGLNAQAPPCSFETDPSNPLLGED